MEVDDWKSIKIKNPWDHRERSESGNIIHTVAQVEGGPTTLAQGPRYGRERSKSTVAQVETADEDAILAQAAAWSVGDAYDGVEGLFAQSEADAEAELALAQAMGW